MRLSPRKLQIITGLAINKLVVSEPDQILLMVFYNCHHSYGRIFRLDSSQMEWFEVERLSDKVFFIGEAGSTSVPAIGEASELANTINLKRVRYFISYIL